MTVLLTIHAVAYHGARSATVASLSDFGQGRQHNGRLPRVHCETDQSHLPLCSEIHNISPHPQQPGADMEKSECPKR